VFNIFQQARVLNGSLLIDVYADPVEVLAQSGHAEQP